jgi:hypothetical protein
VKLVLEPIFEADFLPCSCGFRPQRNATMALETLRKLGAKGGHHVLDADIRDYFGSIDHEKLMKLVARRVSDRRILKLLRQWLEAEDRTSPARRLIDDLPLFNAAARSAAAPPADPTAAAVVEALADLNPDEMSPRDALQALYALKQMTAKPRE